MISKLVLAVFGGGAALFGSILFIHLNFPKSDSYIKSLDMEESEPILTARPANRASVKEIQNSITPVLEIFHTPPPMQMPSSLPTVLIQNTSENPRGDFNIQTTIPVQTNMLQSVITPNVSHIFYTSSHWKSKYYYCDTDDGWKKLSANYLKSFNTKEELLKNYSRILHQLCED